MYLTLEEHLTQGKFFDYIPSKKEELWQHSDLHKFLTHSYENRSLHTDPYPFQVTSSHFLHILNGKIIQSHLPQEITLKIHENNIEMHLYNNMALDIHYHHTENIYQDITLKIIIDEGVHADVLHHLSAENNVFITHHLESKVHPHAHLNMCHIMNLSEESACICKDYIHLEEHAVGESFSLFSQGAYLHHYLHADLHYKSQMYSHALLWAQDEQKQVFSAQINHLADASRSEIISKQVVNDRAQAAFDVTSKVIAGTHFCDLLQSSKALLLSPQAQVFSKPHMEIYCDELTASHGSTVGALDEQALGYLRSRGIPLEKARALLIRAFSHELLERLHYEPHRHAVEEFVDV